MSDLQNYSKVSAYYNNNQLAEEVELSIERMSGAQEQHTVLKGLAGFSPGSPKMTINVKSAIPAAGFEIATLGADMRDVVVREYTFFAGGKSLTTKGVVIKDKTTHGVDKAAEIDFDAVCQYADWQ